LWPPKIIKVDFETAVISAINEVSDIAYKIFVLRWNTKKLTKSDSRAESVLLCPYLHINQAGEGWITVMKIFHGL